MAGGPCANPFPPHFLHHLHLVGLTSCGARFVAALLVLLLVGDTYGPLVDRDGDGDSEGAAALRYDLRAGFLSVARPLLLRRFSTELSLSEVAANALSSSDAEVSSPAACIICCMTMFAMPLLVPLIAARSRCSSAVAICFMMNLMDVSSCTWL